MRPRTSKPLTMALEPAQIIRAAYWHADTGQPIPHAIVSVGAPVQNERATAPSPDSEPTTRGGSA